MTDPNPKQAYGDRKVKLQLVPPAASVAIAKGLAEGAEKYGPWNWREDPVELMTYLGATQRHLAAWVEGEELDPDSEHAKAHLDGAIASLAIIIDALAMGNAIDNRPLPAKGALERLQQGAAIETITCHLMSGEEFEVPAVKPEPLGPDWEEAPEWAEWWAMDYGGLAYFYENLPVKRPGVHSWIPSSGEVAADEVHGDNCPCWSESLQRRPE